MGDPDTAFEDLMNRPLDRIHEYIEILKVCVVIVTEGPIFRTQELTYKNKK